MTGMRRKVSKIVACYYLIMIIMLGMQGKSICGGNILLMFPFGILMPKAVFRFERVKVTAAAGLLCSLILEMIRLHGGSVRTLLPAVSLGMLGVMAGYAGYMATKKETF